MKEFNVPQELKDDQVKLVLLKKEDFDSLYAVASDPLIWEQHPSKDRYQEKVFRGFFDEALESQRAYVIYNIQTNELIGSTRFYDPDPERSTVAIGYTFFARNYWGGVYNGAVKRLMLDHAFQFAEQVLFHVGAMNMRSQKAVLKLGAEKVREFEREFSGIKTLHHEYSLSKQTWNEKMATRL